MRPHRLGVYGSVRRLYQLSGIATPEGPFHPPFRPGRLDDRNPSLNGPARHLRVRKEAALTRFVRLGSPFVPE